MGKVPYKKNIEMMLLTMALTTLFWIGYGIIMSSIITESVKEENERLKIKNLELKEAGKAKLLKLLTEADET